METLRRSIFRLFRYSQDNDRVLTLRAVGEVVVPGRDGDELPATSLVGDDPAADSSFHLGFVHFRAGLRVEYEHLASDRAGNNEATGRDDDAAKWN